MTTTYPKNPSPTQELEAIWWATLTPSFVGVMACLRSQLPEEVHEASWDSLAMGVMTAPGVVTMCTSHIIGDKLTGATYLDTVTTSAGRVALSNTGHETPAQGPMIEDVTDLVLLVERCLPLGDGMIQLLLLSRQNKCRLPMGR